MAVLERVCASRCSWWRPAAPRSRRRNGILRRVARPGVALLALVPVLWSTPALAASPYPNPTTADQLACDLSPARNPGDYSSWWEAVPGNGTYRNWFWNSIVPNGSTACRTDVAGTFWNQAVPDNWVIVDDIGGWPWSGGGYYTQELWLHAIPDNWAVVADIGGWTDTSGGYYRQQFWLNAVPDNWAGVGDIGGWPWPSGGYYTQWLWLHAVPDSWADVGDIGGWPWPSGGYYTQWLWLDGAPDNVVPAQDRTLGHRPTPTAWPDFSQGDQGYYRYWLWEGAIPDNWVMTGDIGGWPWSAGGYYTQWFWLHAVPDSWAADQAMVIDGKSGAGYYDYWFYHFATVRDFAWRSAFSIGGSSGAGYFDYWYHDYFGPEVPHYQTLLALAGGYLDNASTYVPVSGWYGGGAQAVVIFTFDTEGTEADTCAITDVLNRQGVPGTFYIWGGTAQELTPTWVDCLSGMDVENHTLNHPGAFSLSPDTFMDTLSDADQQNQIQGVIPLVQASIPDAPMTSFRTPWCDGNKAFDGSVIRNLMASGMTSDRSVANVPGQARAAGVVPPLGLSALSLASFPAPFVAGSSDGHDLLEFPFTYPSDWTSTAINGMNPSAAPPYLGAPGYTVTLWAKEFDEIYNQHGLMVVLMHPWIQSSDGSYAAGLDSLITYMKARPGVAFTTVDTANRTARRQMGLPSR